MVNDAVIDADPVDLYRRATARAIDVARRVEPDQLKDPTPCSAWNVQDLLDHMTGGTEYLLAALEQREPAPRQGATAADFEVGVSAVLDGLAARARWIGCACRRSGSSGRSAKQSRGRSWMC